MQKNLITSRLNPLIQRLRKLKTKTSGPFQSLVLEGVRLIEEGLGCGLPFEFFLFTKEFLTSMRGKSLFNKLKNTSVPLYFSTREVMDAVSLEETPPGCLALAHIPDKPWDSASKKVAVLCGVHDPGNAGSILRTAEGAGFSVWFSEESVHPFHPKVVKASMGSIFRVSVGRGEVKPFLLDLKKKGWVLVGTQSSSGIPYFRYSWSPPFALLMGSEAFGLPESLFPFLDEVVKIPLHGKVESLNVAASAAILCFDALRQEREKALRS